MKRYLLLGACALLWVPAASAQRAPTGSSRILCIKAREGKAVDLRAFLTGTVAKIGKYRVESGGLSAFVIAEAVAPAGRAARCDYHLVFGSPDIPAESINLTDEMLKKAGVPMTLAQWDAKRMELADLVSTEFWRMRYFVGSSVKGGYVRLNYFKTKDGELQNWVEMEQEGWKQLADAFAKETPGRGWGLYTLGLPGGTMLPYNAMTVDAVPTWNMLFNAAPPRQTWMKVHPDTDFAGYMNRLGQLADRTMVHTMHIVEVFVKQ